EFISRTLAVFLSQNKIDSHFIAPGSPWQNGHAESFVSRLRDEILDVEVFHNLADAQVKLAVYRCYYNEVRPHSSIGHIPPTRFAGSQSCRDGVFKTRNPGIPISSTPEDYS
ncbi:MAG: integrase core domain-containing protein, partial [Fimbriimonadaceae bacterium]